jgi:hypothetical protein
MMGAGVLLRSSREANAAIDPWAATVARPAQIPALALVGMAVKLYDTVLTPEDREQISHEIRAAIEDAGRELHSFLTGRGGGARPSASLTFRIGSIGKEGLSIDGTLEDVDGDGQAEVRHHGTAPQALHSHMRAHLRQIVGKADAWLRSHAM